MKAKKCEKLSMFLLGIENFTFREMHIGEKSSSSLLYYFKTPAIPFIAGNSDEKCVMLFRWGPAPARQPRKLACDWSICHDSTKTRALQVPPVVPYKALENFSKALYGLFFWSIW